MREILFCSVLFKDWQETPCKSLHLSKKLSQLFTIVDPLKKQYCYYLYSSSTYYYQTTLYYWLKKVLLILKVCWKLIIMTSLFLIFSLTQSKLLCPNFICFLFLLKICFAFLIFYFILFHYLKVINVANHEIVVCWCPLEAGGKIWCAMKWTMNSVN